MADINYAKEYSNALAQAYPYTLFFGALYASENNQRYRWVNAKTIEIPNIVTKGRADADRDTIAAAARNYDNNWETKALTNQRKWSTLVHPMDIDQTNLVASIQNITQVFNQEQKFPEMDAYLASNLYDLWIGQGGVPEHTALNAGTVLSEFDKLMIKMDNARVPSQGRILYVTNEVDQLLKQSTSLQRIYNVQDPSQALDRGVSRIEEVEVVAVPSVLMRTEYDFTEGWEHVDGADQINMLLVHPSAVITPVSYQFAKLDAPTAMTQGKYFYYEESFEDVFLLNNKVDGVQMHTTVKTSQDNTLKSLSLGALDISPVFAKATTSYTATATAASNTLKASSADPDAAIVVKYDSVEVTTGTGSVDKAITWESGAKALTIAVTTEAGTKTYTITVTKSG